MIESSRPQDDLPAASNDTEFIERLRRLAEHVNKMVVTLNTDNTLHVHKRINQSYYMQKNAELALLTEQVVAARHHLDHVVRRAELHYREIFHTWYPDAKWLQHYLRTLPSNRS